MSTGQAFTQAPLTLDYDVVTTLLGELQPGMIEDGTAVGMGLATAVKRLQASDAASKVVILLTDGRSNSGEIGPVTAGQMAQALGSKGVPNRVDPWGPEWHHDWPTWRNMLPKYLDEWTR